MAEQNTVKQRRMLKIEAECKGLINNHQRPTGTSGKQEVEWTEMHVGNWIQNKTGSKHADHGTSQHQKNKIDLKHCLFPLQT